MANSEKIKGFAELSCKSCEMDGDCSIQDSYEVNWYKVANNTDRFFCSFHSEIEDEKQ